ncbi:pyridoxamine 5'-phosphate oxidase family protein [Microbacterium oleivorans]|uniref:pyridoxamine 5'-phosphate oxidase family protein n=1 Tax=Microbacterium oleivorans TaxID=273677 RepID=UPI0010A3DF07|nr:pyridoxamine 5'-phosphate oxidase family protein [Microbacterium oleivorans]THE07502.1 pyridoxamine 5'-phosphate oxidase family protein [Microbacterium oleivorans]
MTGTTTTSARAMGEDECWNLLARGTLGRLAVTGSKGPEIFPVTYVVDGPSVLFRTAPGAKLIAMALDARVAFEADEYDDVSAASVVVQGVARSLTVQSEIDAAESLGLVSWLPTLKYRWVRIAAGSISGRRFQRGPEPARYRASLVDDIT